MNDLQTEVKELLESRTQSFREIAEKHKISVPTLTKIKKGKEVSLKTLVYLRSVLE
jgi:predicted transcriptional regulator